MFGVNELASATLLAHLLGAICAAVLVVASLVVMYRRMSRHYRPMAVWMAWCAGLQLVSGSALTLLRLQETSLPKFCARIGVYVAAIGLVETMLYLRTARADRRAFPAAQVALPFAGSMILVLPTCLILLNGVGG